MKKSAFTLAEVLITLGIIGVVAAITLPTVLTKVESMVLKNQFKKSYTMLSQALTKAQQELGDTPACFRRYKSLYSVKCSAYNSLGVCTAASLLDGSPVPVGNDGPTTECKTFWPIFRKQMKIVKTCKNYSYKNGCIPKYNGRDTIAQNSQTAKPGDADYNENYGAQKIAACARWTQSLLENTASSYVLADGSIIIGDYNNDSSINFAMDINGKKGPNKWGQDVFVFQFKNPDKQNRETGVQLFIGAGDCMTAEDGGVLTSTMIQNLYK